MQVELQSVKMVNPSELVSTLRNSFNSGKTKPLKYRERQLRALLKLYEENVDAMVSALASDLHKPRFESILTEVQYLINDIKNVLSNFKTWAQPEYPPKALANLLDSMCILNEPYGVVLIMGSWNYPIQLTLLPVAGAIAAGNCVVIKPSELSSASSKFMAETIPKYLDSDICQVYEGGPNETSTLLKERFDYIFYTGSSAIGKLIHSAANQYLTPVTLELGGKSPVYLDHSADIKIATKRLLWGKVINAGQTCVAPDYLICTSEVRDRFIQTAKQVLHDFFGGNPQKSPDYCRIINERHFKRIVDLMTRNGTITIGGNFDASDLYIEPTVITDVKLTDPIMTEEIFGPLLPIITVKDAYEAIKLINSKEKPLVFYIFSNSKSDVQLLIENTSSGGLCINDTVMHMATDMPFGGLGHSGMGRYHGKHTFDTFSHKRSSLFKNLGVLGETLSAARYPPYSKGKLRYLNFLLGLGGLPKLTCLKYLIVFSLGALGATYYKKVLRGLGAVEL